jgi:hypothetical protein
MWNCTEDMGFLDKVDRWDFLDNSKGFAILIYGVFVLAVSVVHFYFKSYWHEI